MKRLLSLTLLLIFALCAPAFAGTAYYADLSDSGSTNQGTFAEPFNTIATINAQSFSTGDDLYFKAGTEATLTATLDLDWSGTSGDRVIIGGYWDDGGSPNTDMTGKTRPVLSGNGHTFPTGEYQALVEGNGIDYVTIQDIKVSESYSYGIVIQGHSSRGTSDNCIIQRCYSYHCGKGGFNFFTVSSHGYGVKDSYIQYNTSEYDDYPDIISGTVSGITVSASFLDETTENIVVRHNKVFKSTEGIGIYKTANDVIVEYNVVRDCGTYFLYAAGGSHDITFRYNLVYEGDDDLIPHDSLIVVDNECHYRVPPSSTQNIYIYGNLIANGRYGIKLSNNCEDYEDLVPTGIYIYNNTIVDCSEYNFRFSDSWNGTAIIYNNISAIYDSSGTHSNDYSPTGVTWGYNNFSSTVTGNAHSGTGTVEETPVLSTTSGWTSLTSGSVDGTGFAITSSSPGKDVGTDLGTPYNIGLFEGTDFSTSPTTVATASHLDHGEGTDIGAWVYKVTGGGGEGECLLSCEGFGESGYSVGKGDWDIIGTENTSGSTIAICKVEVYCKKIGDNEETPTFYIDVFDRDGNDLDDESITAVGSISWGSFPTGSPSQVELEVDPPVNLENGQVIGVSTHGNDDVDHYYGMYYGTGTTTTDLGIPERWDWGGTRQDSVADNELSIKLYHYTVTDDAIAVTDIGTATVSGSIVTFATDRTDTDTAAGNPGYYFALELNRQPSSVYSTPDSTTLKWDCGPLSTDYCEAPFYACLPDSSGTYYLLYDPNLIAGNRSADPQLYGDGSEALIMNDGVILDADANSLDDDSDGYVDVGEVDISSGTLIIAVGGITFYVSTSGDDTLDGQTESTAWEHHPWMDGATDEADFVTLVGGDTVYFKYGDTFTDAEDRMNEHDNGISDYITMAGLSTWGSGEKPLLCPTRTWTADWVASGITNVYYHTTAAGERPFSWLWFGSVSEATAGAMEDLVLDMDTNHQFVYNANASITYDNLDNDPNSFEVGETVTGGTNGYTCKILYDNDSDTMVIEQFNNHGTGYVDDEVLTGGTSGATCDVNGSPMPSLLHYVFVYSTTDLTTTPGTIYYSAGDDYGPFHCGGADVGAEFDYHKWQNLRFWGGGQGALWYLQPAADDNNESQHLIIDDCDFKYSSHGNAEHEFETAAVMIGEQAHDGQIGDVTITDCTFDEIGRRAIMIGRMDAGTNSIERNTITDIRGERNVYFNRPVGIYLAEVTNTTVKQNSITFSSDDSEGPNVWTAGLWNMGAQRGTYTDVVISRNYIHGFGKGLYSELGDDAVWAYNVAVNCMVGLEITGATDSVGCGSVKFYNNDLVDCHYYGIRHLGYQLDDTEMILKNNAIISPEATITGDGGNYDIVNIVDAGGAGFGGTITFDYNAYEVANDLDNMFKWKGSDDPFTTWDNSRDANGVCNANLKLRDVSGVDYRLQAGSPCKDTGTDVSLTEDYEGKAVPKGRGVDIGAYEHRGHKRDISRMGMNL